MPKDLATLFKTPLRVRVLAYLLRTSTLCSANEVAKALRVSRRAVDKELKAIAKAGVATARPPRKEPRYQINEEHPLVRNLHTLLAEAMTPTDAEIVGAFRGASGVTLLVATGVLARDDRGAVDLLIVTRSPHSPALARAIIRIERIVGLPIRYSVMGVEEYLNRRQSFDRLLRDVFDFSHRILVMRLPTGAAEPLG